MSTVSLTWTPSAGIVTSYNVMRGTASGAEILLTTSTAANYTDSSVVEGTTYFYVVSAVNAAGTSGASNEVSVSIPLTAPSAPTNLVATLG